MNKNSIKIYEFEQFKQHATIVHGIFTRAGGTSTGAFASLNIGSNSGDNSKIITANRKLVAKKMGAMPMIFLKQVHGANIKIFKNDTENTIGCNVRSVHDTYTADGIITDVKGVNLVIQVADCQAVMLYDYKNQVIANIHSGWKGSIKNTIGKCVDKMISQFSCKPENIIAGISPSLGPCCSEFIKYKNEIPKNLWLYKIEEKNYFDFWKLSCDQLMEKGVKKENITNLQICTKCNSDMFYSYRNSKTTGRFACAIAMI